MIITLSRLLPMVCALSFLLRPFRALHALASQSWLWSFVASSLLSLTSVELTFRSQVRPHRHRASRPRPRGEKTQCRLSFLWASDPGVTRSRHRGREVLSRGVNPAGPGPILKIAGRA